MYRLRCVIAAHVEHRDILASSCAAYADLMETVNQAEVYKTYQHPPTPYGPTLSLGNYVAIGLFSEQHDATAKLVASRHVMGKCYQHLAMTQEVTDQPLWHDEFQQTRDKPNRVRSLMMSEKKRDLKNLSVFRD